MKYFKNLKNGRKQSLVLSTESLLQRKNFGGGQKLLKNRYQSFLILSNFSCFLDIVLQILSATVDTTGRFNEKTVF